MLFLTVTGSRMAASRPLGQSSGSHRWVTAGDNCVALDRGCPLVGGMLFGTRWTTLIRRCFLLPVRSDKVRESVGLDGGSQIVV